MSTPNDAADPPAPDSRSSAAANMPERCNTRIIDPALLADFVPPAPPESSQEAPAAVPEKAHSDRRHALSERPVPGVVVRNGERLEETSPPPPAAKTMVVPYAPKPSRDVPRTMAVLLIALSLLAIGSAAAMWLRGPSVRDATPAATRLESTPELTSVRPAPELHHPAGFGGASAQPAAPPSSSSATTAEATATATGRPAAAAPPKKTTTATGTGAAAPSTNPRRPSGEPQPAATRMVFPND